MHLSLKHIPPVLRPNQARVLLRQFAPGDSHRTARIVEGLLLLPEPMVDELLQAILASFGNRHLDLRGQFLERFSQLPAHPGTASLSLSRRLLIGSYFLAEYSLESAALFNPSVVPHPDQSDLPAGALRFVLSLRATGEGHISSITFRTGILHPGPRIEMDHVGRYLSEPRRVPAAHFETALFGRKLAELGLGGTFSDALLSSLGDSFELPQLRSALDKALDCRSLPPDSPHHSTGRGIWVLAQSNFDVAFEPSHRISERVLFPATESQRNGIEDARFVRFRKPDGSHIYYATFTAFDGRIVVPELVETEDFLRFRFLSLNGPAAENKGMAIFPRLINGRYAMLARQDNENIYLMFSDNVHFWNTRTLLAAPAFPWELVQIGNCGSPIETPAGWLVLTHGVGPMRSYSIGALLLDLDDPSRVLGRTRLPLLQAGESERSGYVPNVVYSCGALLHDGHIIIPYGFADHASSFATIPLHSLLAALQPVGTTAP